MSCHENILRFRRVLPEFRQTAFSSLAGRECRISITFNLPAPGIPGEIYVYAERFSVKVAVQAGLQDIRRPWKLGLLIHIIHLPGLCLNHTFRLRHRMS